MKKSEQIIKIYQKRQQAHDTLLECDVLLDNLLKELLKKTECCMDEVKDLIVKEVNIARSEGEKTSRLTSLYNKLPKL